MLPHSSPKIHRSSVIQPPSYACDVVRISSILNALSARIDLVSVRAARDVAARGRHERGVGTGNRLVFGSWVRCARCDPMAFARGSGSGGRTDGRQTADGGHLHSPPQHSGRDRSGNRVFAVGKCREPDLRPVRSRLLLLPRPASQRRLSARLELGQDMVVQGRHNGEPAASLTSSETGRAPPETKTRRAPPRASDGLRPEAIRIGHRECPPPTVAPAPAKRRGHDRSE